MKNTTNLVRAEIQRSQLAVIGLSNVSVIDTRVNKLNNDYQDFITMISNLDSNTPIFGSAVQARDVTAGNILAFPAANLSTNDKLVALALPPKFRPKMVFDAIAGLLIAEKYMEFSQGGTHTVEIILMNGNFKDDKNSRVLTVEPTSGVNTVSEYVILPTIQPLLLGPTEDVAYAGGTAPFTNSYSKSAGNYLSPWPIQAPYTETPTNKFAYSAILVVFKDLAGQGNLSVTPIFSGQIASKMVADILNS